MDFNCKGTNLHIHTSAAGTQKVQWTLEIEAMLRGVSVVVVQQSVSAACSHSRIIDLSRLNHLTVYFLLSLSNPFYICSVHQVVWRISQRKGKYRGVLFTARKMFAVKSTPLYFCPFEPSIKCFSQYGEGTSMCYQTEFHARGTFLVKVKGELHTKVRSAVCSIAYRLPFWMRRGWEAV